MKYRFAYRTGLQAPSVGGAIMGRFTVRRVCSPTVERRADHITKGCSLFIALTKNSVCRGDSARAGDFLMSAEGLLCAFNWRKNEAQIIVTPVVALLTEMVISILWGCELKRFLFRIEDKILDRIASVVVAVGFTLIAILITATIAVIAKNTQLFLVLAVLILVVSNASLVFLVLRFQRYGKWSKSGNIWWLCYDLQGAISKVDPQNPDDPSTRQVERQLLKCLHHAEALGIDEKNVVRRLQQLRDMTRGYVATTMPVQIRDEFFEQLRSIFNDVAQFLQNNQPDFDSGPELL